jgi:hypothetical protein
MTTTWAAPREVNNAYHFINDKQPIYDCNNKLLGRWNGFKARPTYKSCGSIQISLEDGTGDIWYTGEVTKWGDGYKLLRYGTISN